MSHILLPGGWSWAAVVGSDCLTLYDSITTQLKTPVQTVSIEHNFKKGECVDKSFCGSLPVTMPQLSTDVGLSLSVLSHTYLWVLLFKQECVPN